MIGVAGIGNKCRIAGYVVPSNWVPPIDTIAGQCWSATTNEQSLEEAIWKAYEDGIRIINVSWAGMGVSDSVAIEMAKEITQGGATLITAGGNKPEHTWHSA